MKSSATAEFWQHYAALPARVQRDARKAYELWRREPRHRSLHFKKVRNVWSVRVSRGYRALGLFERDTVFWFWIGAHDKYERIIKS